MTDASVAARVKAEQVAILYRNGAQPLIATVVAGGGVAYLMVKAGGIDPVVAGGWVAVLSAFALVRLFLRAAYLRHPPLPGEQGRWADWFTLGALAGGVCWGVGSVILMPPGHFDLQLLVVLVLTSICAATVPAFGSHLPAFYALYFPAIVPSVIWSALQNDLRHWIYVGLASLWIPMLALLARRYGQNNGEALRLKYENLELVESLGQQKAAAEQANVAKSRFLASASHDLRQPVHALGMFVGALRAHRMDAKARLLVDHIEGSVGALDSLFTALLDISRLDAGVIESRPFAMPINAILARVCRDLAPEAALKGFRLRHVDCSALVVSDPVLLERVLRNLVGNAVRYTQGGKVLVGCRRREGRLDLEVWDTGPGIPADQRDQVFQEFYQLGNPDRDRAKGLGLGLAIVRRLTELLGHRLTLTSASGKGSMFRVSLGLASDDAPGPAVAGGPGRSLENGLILVVDDEAAIREAMVSLLGGWGHEVIAAGSCAEMLEALADCPRRPDLIISDYRLRDGENGIAVIQRLQSEFNEDIPAVLLTGDTAPDRIREARESGYPLLHKPLTNERLRAAIAGLAAGDWVTVKA